MTETAASNNEAGPAWTMMPTTLMARPSASKLTSWECQSMHRAAMPLKSSCELTKGVLHVRETRTRGTRARSGVRLQKESKLQLAPAGSAGGKADESRSTAAALLITEPTIEMASGREGRICERPNYCE